MKALRIMRSRSSRVLLAAGLAGAVAALCAAVHIAQAAPPAPAADSTPAPTARVKTVPARQGPIAETLHAWGSIDFSNAELSTLGLPYASQLSRLAVSAGQAVRKGAVLAEMTADPAVAATYVQAQSAANAARDELRRTRSLYQQQLATQSQLASAQKAASDADTTLAELDRQGATPGPRALKAPFDGVVISIAAAQGDRVAAGATVMQLGHQPDAGAVHASLGIDPARAGLVRAGAAVHAAPLGGAAASSGFDGRVAAIRQVVNPQTRLVDASVLLQPAAGATPLPGTAVAAEIEVARSVHWIVPRSALLEDAQGAYVYQVADGHAHRVAVSRQVESGDVYGVDGPLADGAPLVVLGNYELSDGMAVAEAAP